MGWLAEQLTDLPDLLAGAELDAGEVGSDDARDLAAAAPEIVRAVERCCGGCGPVSWAGPD